MSQISDNLDYADAPEEQPRTPAHLAPTAAASAAIEQALEAGAKAEAAAIQGAALAMASQPRGWGPQASVAALRWDGHALEAFQGSALEVLRSLDAAATTAALIAAAEALEAGVLISATAAARWGDAPERFSPAPLSGQHWRSPALAAELRQWASEDGGGIEPSEASAVHYRGHPLRIAGDVPASLKALGLLEEYSLRDLSPADRMDLAGAAVGYAAELDQGDFADLDGHLDRLDELRRGTAPAASGDAGNEESAIAVVDQAGRVVLLAAASAVPFGAYGPFEAAPVRAAMLFRTDHPYLIFAPNGRAPGLVPSLIDLLDGQVSPAAFGQGSGWSFGKPGTSGSTFEVDLGFEQEVSAALRSKGHRVDIGSRSRALIALDEMLVPTAFGALEP